MEITELSFDFINQPLAFSKEKEGITKIELVNGDAKVHFGKERTLTVKERYIITYTEGTSLSTKGDKDALQAYHLKNKKKKK